MWNLQPAGFQGFYGRLPQHYDRAVDCGVVFYSVTLEINSSLLFFIIIIHGVLHLSETFDQRCLQGLNGHVSSGENGRKTSEITDQSGSLMCDSLTVTLFQSWNSYHVSHCCCNVEVPEHWDLEGAMEVKY